MEYVRNGGDLEVAARMTGHLSILPTQPCNQLHEETSLGETECAQIWSHRNPAPRVTDTDDASDLVPDYPLEDFDTVVGARIQSVRHGPDHPGPPCRTARAGKPIILRPGSSGELSERP